RHQVKGRVPALVQRLREHGGRQRALVGLPHGVESGFEQRTHGTRVDQAIVQIEDRHGVLHTGCSPFKHQNSRPHLATTDTPWPASVRLTGAPTSSGVCTWGDTTKMLPSALAKVYSMTLPR